MAVMAVRADAEHLRPHRLKVAEGIAERAQLALAGVREVEDVEGEDHRSAAGLLRQRHGFRLVAQHREIGGLLADLDHAVT